MSSIGLKFIQSGYGINKSISGYSTVLGPTGPQGYQGDIGPQGYQGDIGPQGYQGHTGAGFTSILNFSENHILVAKTDNQAEAIDSLSISPSGTILNFTGAINVTDINTRSINIIESLQINSGANITSYSDIYIPDGKIYSNICQTNILTGSVLNQIDYLIQSYTNSANVYEDCINSIVSIIIKSANQSYYVGSGFFVTGPSSNQYSYICTAGHVIIDPNVSGYPVCSDIWVNTYYPSNSIYKVTGTHKVMGIDKIADVALIRLELSGSKVLSIKNSRTECNIGDTINTIGYPGSIDAQSISRGIIRDNKSQPDGEVMESVLTDISIFGGNSGGPLITNDKKVVGIVSYGYTNQQEINGGVASYLFKPILDYFLINYVNTVVSFPKGYLGIQYSPVDILIATILNLSTVQGYRVIGLDSTIVPANFSIGDIITEIEGNKVGIMNNQYPLFTEIHLRTPGTSVQIKYRPNGNYTTELTKTVILSSFNSSNDYLFSNFHRTPINTNLLL